MLGATERATAGKLGRDSRTDASLITVQYQGGFLAGFDFWHPGAKSGNRNANASCTANQAN